MLALLVGCTRGSTSSNPPIHLNPNMDDQPRYEAQASSDFFADGAAMRVPVAGTVARGSLADGPEITTGMAGGAPVDRSPIPVDEELLARGADRYAIYCQPCHAMDGSGQSMLRERAGVATADLTQERLVAVSDGYIFDVVTHGLGLMQSYAYQVPPRDRWAIIAWVRHLQSEAAASAVESQVMGVPEPPAGESDEANAATAEPADGAASEPEAPATTPEEGT